ncbi:MAG TPA: hypothetical protein VK166_01925 [Chitinophagaceae bacterium]|nr:hypothetical protein [Chitinophagaceae bacterium]
MRSIILLIISGIILTIFSCSKDSNDPSNTEVYKYPKVTDNKYYFTYTTSGVTQGYGFNKTPSDFGISSYIGNEVTSYTNVNNIVYGGGQMVGSVIDKSFLFKASKSCGSPGQTRCFFAIMTKVNVSVGTVNTITGGSYLDISEQGGDEFTYSAGAPAGGSLNNPQDFNITITEVGSQGDVISGTFSGTMFKFSKGGVNFLGEVFVTGSFSAQRER